MDNEFVAYINEVVKEIFSSMVFQDIETGNPMQRSKDCAGIPPVRKDISVIVGLGGELTASVIVHFEKVSALRITSNMLGIPYEQINEDVKEAVGEISTMIAVGLKVGLAKTGIDLSQSMPILVNGNDFETSCLAGTNSVMIPFFLEDSTFIVEFSFNH